MPNSFTSSRPSRKPDGMNFLAPQGHQPAERRLVTNSRSSSGACSGPAPGIDWGASARTRQFEHLNVGDKVILQDGEWPVVEAIRHRRRSFWKPDYRGCLHDGRCPAQGISICGRSAGGHRSLGAAERHGLVPPWRRTGAWYVIPARLGVPPACSSHCLHNGRNPALGAVFDQLAALYSAVAAAPRRSGAARWV